MSLQETHRQEEHVKRHCGERQSPNPDNSTGQKTWFFSKNKVQGTKKREHY